MLSEEPSLAELIEAVRAEDRSADLAGAVRRYGDQNFVLEADGWIYRFPRGWIDFEREMAVLNALEHRLPVATPRVEWVGQHNRFCAYRKITGWPFDPSSYRAAPRQRQQALAASMAEYLIALHGVLTEAEIESIGIPDFFTLASRADLIDINDVPEPIRAAVDSMLQRARELSGQLDGRMLLDNDFTSDNIVLDAEMGLLAGVWDYSGVSVGPASFDFRALLRDPDPLTQDVVHEYEQRTGREICREAFTIAFRITDLRRHLRTSPTAAINLVHSWQAP
ncbi:MAG: phosphotransferase [Mycobacterium sp.]|nr:phosphotransferase [Mycobacterium sp.]